VAERTDRAPHGVRGGLGRASVSDSGQSAGQSAGELDRLGRRIRDSRPRLRREHPGCRGRGLPGPCDLVGDLSVGDLGRITYSTTPVHIHIKTAPLELVRLVRAPAYAAQDLNHPRRRHGRELGGHAGLIKGQRGDQQPADLLQLVPLQHPAHRRSHPHAPGQERERHQAESLAALLDRQRRQGVRPRRSACSGQRLGVAQKLLRVARRRDSAREELSFPRCLDGPKIHRASVTRPSQRRSPPAPRVASSTPLSARSPSLRPWRPSC
jgi:hypothetical protein